MSAFLVSLTDTGQAGYGQMLPFDEKRRDRVLPTIPSRDS
jgi:hypothetical protein